MPPVLLLLCALQGALSSREHEEEGHTSFTSSVEDVSANSEAGKLSYLDWAIQSISGTPQLVAECESGGWGGCPQKKKRDLQPIFTIAGQCPGSYCKEKQAMLYASPFPHSGKGDIQNFWTWNGEGNGGPSCSDDAAYPTHHMNPCGANKNTPSDSFFANVKKQYMTILEVFDLDHSSYEQPRLVYKSQDKVFLLISMIVEEVTWSGMSPKAFKGKLLYQNTALKVFHQDVIIDASELAVELNGHEQSGMHPSFGFPTTTTTTTTATTVEDLDVTPSVDDHDVTPTVDDDDVTPVVDDDDVTPTVDDHDVTPTVDDDDVTPSVDDDDVTPTDDDHDGTPTVDEHDVTPTDGDHEDEELLDGRCCKNSKTKEFKWMSGDELDFSFKPWKLLAGEKVCDADNHWHHAAAKTDKECKGLEFLRVQATDDGAAALNPILRVKRAVSLNPVDPEPERELDGASVANETERGFHFYKRCDTGSVCIQSNVIRNTFSWWRQAVNCKGLGAKSENSWEGGTCAELGFTCPKSTPEGYYNAPILQALQKGFTSYIKPDADGACPA